MPFKGAIQLQSPGNSRNGNTCTLVRRETNCKIATINEGENSRNGNLCTLRRDVQASNSPRGIVLPLAGSVTWAYAPTRTPHVLAEAAIEELRRRRIVLPPVLVIERVCAQVATRAQRQIYKALSEWLTTEQRTKLDQLLESREGGSHSLLAWLRLPPGASARNILSHIERLQEIRAIGIPAETSKKVHQNRLLRLAREGAQTAVFQLQEYETERRYATLVAKFSNDERRSIYGTSC
jgi:Domain of unknown function (DUF4158)